MTARREPMSKVDTAWLRMEQPSNLMMITGVIVLSGPVDFRRFEEAIANRFLAFARFRQKAVPHARGYWWEEDPNFELSAHIRHTALPGPAGKKELQQKVSELASTPLDQTKPLWQFHLVDNYDQGPVVIARIHHCYADGIALVQVMLSLTESDRQRSNQMVEQEHWSERRALESNIFKRLMGPAQQGMRSVQKLGYRLLQESQELMRDPEAFAAQASLIGDLTQELAHLLTISDDPPSRLKRSLGVRKNVAWAQPVSLDEVKALGQVLGCTVNDVLIAVMTGALHRYLQACGDDPTTLTMRATVPVNLRPLEHAKDLGNHFGLVFLDLPIDEASPLGRVVLVSQAMDELKSSKQAAMSLGLLGAVGMAPAAIQKPALDLFSNKATTVLTNVPGPQQPLYLAGSAIEEMMFWVPQNGTIGMGVSLMSYAGRVFAGLIADQNLIPDPTEVMNFFRQEYDALLYLGLMLGPEWSDLDDEALLTAHDWVYSLS